MSDSIWSSHEGDFTPTWDEYIHYTFSLPNKGWPDVLSPTRNPGSELTLYWSTNFVIAGAFAFGTGVPFETAGGYLLFRGWAFRYAVTKAALTSTPSVLAPLVLAVLVGTSIVENVNPHYTRFETERQQRGQDQASAGSHYRW